MSRKKNRKRNVANRQRQRVGPAQPQSRPPQRKETKRRTARRQRATQKRRQQIVTIVLVIGVVAVFGSWLANRASSAPQVSEERLALVAARGPENAPVTITEYGDFNCPACRAWYQAGIIEQLLVEYPGQVRFEFRHFPVITPRSPKLAEAAECALDQGKFWEMHDILYDFAPTNTTGAMKDYAAQIGLDQAQFDECLDSGQYASIVQAHQGQAFSLGFRGTPSFSVNGQPLVNPSPETIRTIIEQALVASQ